jgi:hypothetical protein
MLRRAMYIRFGLVIEPYGVSQDVPHEDPICRLEIFLGQMPFRDIFSSKITHRVIINCGFLPGSAGPN